MKRQYSLAYRAGFAGRRSRALCALSAMTVLIFCLLVSGCASLSDQAKALVGHEAPQSRLMLLSGEHIALNSLLGKEVALLFWATWCPHSRAGIEEFAALARRYKDNPKLEFYAVSVDSNDAYEELQNRIRLQNLKQMTHVFSGNDVQDEAFLAFHGERLPYAVFIDEAGVVRLADLGVGGLASFLDRRFGG